MDKISSEDIQRILKKHQDKLRERIDLDEMESFPGESFSREYKIFREEALVQKVLVYERLCNFSEKILKVSPKEENKLKIQEAIDVVHLNITPEGAAGFAGILSILLIIFAILLGVFGYYLAGGEIGFTSSEGGLKDVGFSIYFWPILLLLLGGVITKPVSNYPIRIANKWRLKASNQMVLAILYVVMYMRHTSNLENAIKFAGEHVGNPLALDFRKILWDVESGSFVTIKEALDQYLSGWRNYSLEFVESFHLVESSLYESDENRRISLLEKGLEVILDGTYERMLHYAHDLRSPITMLYMLGVILPVLGLVVFPLMSGFLGGVVKWWHLSMVYNVILPVFVYFFGQELLAKRPGGYGSEDILEQYPEFDDYSKIDFFGIKINPLLPAVLIGGIIVLIGLLPIIIFYVNGANYDFELFGYKFLDYKEFDDGYIGPYGLWSMLLSMFVPLGIAFGVGIYYYFFSKNLIRIRENTMKLEKEFSGAIFQIGNRVGDGIPVESAFSKVAENMKNSPAGDFLRIVAVNIQKLGMSVKEAIFNIQRGAITYFPSNLIKSSMKVLVESAKKGPLVVSKSLITISDYVNRVDKIAERLKDLLADIISSMKSQISFLTPMIAAIVVGVTSMMINIINKLGELFKEFEAGNVETETINTGLLKILGEGGLNIENIIPGYQFQVVVGLFVVEMALILTILSSDIENGFDPVTKKNRIAKNLFVSAFLYFVIALIGILVFSVLASGVATFAMPT